MKRFPLSSDVIKLIALISMTIDHIQSILFSEGVLNQTVGRIAFPAFAYLLIYHFCAYHPVKKYLCRLGIFAVITSALLLPFRPFWDNILWTFFWAVLFLSATEWICKIAKTVFWQFYWMGLLLLALMPWIVQADYHVLGFFFLMALYAYFRKKTVLNYSAVLIAGIIMNAGDILTACSSGLIVVALLSFIDVQSGKRLIKWPVFYLYYPLHLLFLYSIKVLM